MFCFRGNRGKPPEGLRYEGRNLAKALDVLVGTRLGRTLGSLLLVRAVVEEQLVEGKDVALREQHYLPHVYFLQVLNAPNVREHLALRWQDVRLSR